MTKKRIPSWKFDHNFYGLDPETFPVDDTDQKIIGILIENSRISCTEVAKFDVASGR